MRNMIITGSNVYAIWITVGYSRWNPRAAQELGIDTGQMRRHGAFYMVDRLKAKASW